MKEIVLSDGRKAVIKEGKGRDLFWAFENATTQNEIIKMLVIRLVEIEGKPITEDELEDLPISDTINLLNEVGRLISPLSVQRPSSQ
ncbi:hypothetical protein [Pampinifervens florentissimum]|uniref:hypothetical protein n=1 Tax=Pampinifervens florentissimum TaxID=1632019 RepID=UPI0013B47D5A|nr:hypothetical protein [Hydrogenobacter sp. T-8]QID32329.1 hypothetical protein G3M65_00445 [Hydrogenobacter sp. T-8]